LHATDIPRWLLFNVDPLFTCPNLRRVGGRGDGPKWTCDPHRLLRQPDCLIYSIGSRGIYRFEDGIVSTLKEYDPKARIAQEGTESASWLPNCEIHVFDPAPQYGRNGDATNKNIHYHAIGLKSSYEPFKLGTFPASSVFLSFQDIQKQLGHENRRVDIFKIDCEGCEWSTYQDWLHPDVDIRQVLIETHAVRTGPNVFFDRFLDMGFVPFSKEANSHPNAKPTGQLFEWGFVKLHPNFLRRSTNLMNITFA
jgi:Methyltransferase domain